MPALIELIYNGRRHGRPITYMSILCIKIKQQELTKADYALRNMLLNVLSNTVYATCYSAFYVLRVPHKTC